MLQANCFCCKPTQINHPYDCNSPNVQTFAPDTIEEKSTQLRILLQDVSILPHDK